MHTTSSAARTARWLLVALALLALAAVWRAPEVAAWQWRARAGTAAMSTGPTALAPSLHWFDRYYVVADLGDGAFAIGEPLYGQCNFSYLLVGTQHALLFDTGPGVRDISSVVHALTSLPIEALPSHLHFDHTGNLRRFSDVALPDLPALRAQAPDGVMSLGLYQNLGFVEGFERVPFRVTRWLALGSDIDLGDRHVQLISAPGHTPDSVVLLDRRANRVFTGDFIYPSEIYAFLPGADLPAYAASAAKIYTLLNEQTRVYGGHGCDRPPLVEVPTLSRADVKALESALQRAAITAGPVGTGWYPRILPVNENMRLLATYPWMAH